MENLVQEWASGVLWDRRIRGKVYIQDGCRTSNDVRCRDMGSEEITMREEVGCGGNEDGWIGGVTKLDRIRNERIRGTTKVGEISKKVQKSRLKWYGQIGHTCIEKRRRRICGQESDGNGGDGEKNGRKTEGQVVV